MPDSQTLVLFVAAMVAGVVCFRLYSVLGRRTGHEPPPQAAPAQAPNALQPPVQPVQSSNGILEIQLADNSFDTPKFLAGALRAVMPASKAAKTSGDSSGRKVSRSPATKAFTIWA